MKQILPTLMIALACCTADAVRAADAFDWPNWRGPQQDCTSLETNLPAEWDPRGGEGSNLLWKNDKLGGRSTPVVFEGRLYTICRDRPETKLEGEKVVCVDAASGEILWEHVFNVYLSDVPDTRVGWSSPVVDPETGNVYVQGVSGYFCCLDGKTGDVVWQRSLHEEFGFLTTYGGRTNIPVVYADTVITSAVVIGWGDTPQWNLMAKPAYRFLAFDKRTGEFRWLGSTNLIPYDTTYSTPTIARLAGRDVLVFGGGDGCMWALEAGTGRKVWSYNFSRRGLNVSPLVTADGRIYNGHSEENMLGNTMGAVVALDGNFGVDKLPVSLNDKELWLNYEVMAGKSSPVMLDGRLYIIDDRAKLFVFDPETGKQIAKKALGTVMRSTPLVADGKLYVCTNNGRYYTLAPSARDVDTLCKLRINGEASDGSPVVSHGRIYLPMSDAIYCIGNDESIAANKTTDKPLPEYPWAGSVDDAASDAKVAHLQVVPWETTLAPGGKQAMRVRLYDDRGFYIRDAETDEIEFSVVGTGKIDDQGHYIAATDASHECALVQCKMGDLTGTARVRVVPPLPWEFTFDNASDVPLTWVGGRIRYVVREGENGKYIAKPTELPTQPGAPTTKLGTRSQMWMGSPEMSNYTIAADLMLTLGEESSETDPGAAAPEVPGSLSDSAEKLPDIGIINSGYTFTLFGQSQQVRLYSWCTHDRRTQAALGMPIETDVWYSTKLRVEPDRDAGVCRVMAKVWPRGEQEPDQWQLEMVDEAPIYHGAPGLFGSTSNAEAFVDNIVVTPN
jgi:outer membrane protein assembly factor BamB